MAGEEEKQPEKKKKSVDEDLERHGLERCSECDSWHWKTAAARTFHARRCSS